MKSIILALAFACLGQVAVAGEAKNVSQEIADLRSTIVSAEVLLAPNLLESRSDITEKELRKVACWYDAADKADLTPLLDILSLAEIVESPHPAENDLRIAVYLRTSSGAVIPLLIGTEYSNGPTLGQYDGAAVMVPRRVGGDIRYWASTRKSSKPKRACQS